MKNKKMIIGIVVVLGLVLAALGFNKFRYYNTVVPSAETPAPFELSEDAQDVLY